MTAKEKELRIELGKLAEKLDELRAIEKPTPEDYEKVKALCDQVDELDDMIKTEERMEIASAKIGKPISDPTLPQDPAVDPEQRFEDFGEFIQSVIRAGSPPGTSVAGKPGGMIDRRLTNIYQEYRSTGLEESTPSLGGFLVQKDFASEIFKIVHDVGKVFPFVRQIPISGNSNGLKINTIDETSRANGSRLGGMRVVWTDEGEEKTASKPKFGRLELSLNKLAGIVYLTDELRQDAAAVGNIIMQGMSDEVAFALDDAVLNGTGAGQPVGILNANALVSVAKETGQPAATINWENIKKMYARLFSRSRGNMRWLANQDCLPQLMSMTQPVGTGGQTVWLPANGAFGLSHDTLMGRPITYPEQCQTIGTKGDIYLVDLSQYVAITKGGLQSASSIHVRFIYDEEVIRFVFRVDGQSLWKAALTPFKSSDDLSPFISLDTRA